MSASVRYKRESESVSKDDLAQDCGISEGDLASLREIQLILGDPRVRVEVAPTTDCHAAMMAILSTK